VSWYCAQAGRPPSGSVAVNGIFKNFNTIEEFRATEPKKELFNAVTDSVGDHHSRYPLQADRQLLESFETESPNLNPFLLVTFADLKKYVYHYWFAFPALVSKPGWELEGDGLATMSLEASFATFV
jgi:ubiquitin-like modifier-activating enzyme ATG7